MKKMMRLLIVFFCSQFFCCDLNAQINSPFHTQTFDEIKTPNRFEILDVIYTENNEIVKINVDGSTKFLIQLFSNDLKLIKEYTSILKINMPKGALYLGAIKMKGKNYLLYRSRSKGILYNYALEIFIDYLKIGNELVQLSESGELKPFGLISDNFFHSVNSLQQKYSANKSAYMFAFNDESENRNSRYSNDRKDNISISVFDSNLVKLWSMKIASEYDNSYSKKLDIAVTNNFKVLLLTSGYFSYKSFSFQPSPKTNLLVFSKNTSNPIVIELPEEEYNIIDGQICESENGNIYLAGLYTNKSLSNAVIGNYLIELDKTTYKIANSKFYAFPADLFTSDSTGTYQNENIKTKVIYSMSDGSIKLLFEVIKKTKYNWTSDYESTRQVFGGTAASRQVSETKQHENTVYFFHYGDIIVTSVSNNELSWAKRISKTHFAQVTSSLSFYSTSFNNEINLFFNDNLENKDNINKGKFIRYGKYDEGYLAGVCINSNGNTAKYNLIEKLPLKIIDFKNGFGNNILNISENKILFIKKSD